MAGLLATGVSAESIDRYGQPAMCVANFVGDSKIVRLLLGAGADPNRRGLGGTTALTKAASVGHEPIAIDLIHAGVDLNLEDDHGATALILAAGARNLSLVVLFLELGADPNVQARDGRTALSAGSWEVVETRTAGRQFYRRGVRVDRDDAVLRALIAAGAGTVSFL